MPTALPLFSARAPYTRFAPAAGAVSRAIGDVYAILITDQTDPRLLRQAARSVVRAAPSAAVVAVFRAATDPAHAARVGAAAGVAVLPLDAYPLEPSLRAALTDPDGLPRAFRQWLRYAGVTADRRIAATLDHGLERAVEQTRRACRAGPGATRATAPNVDEMADVAGLTARGLRAAFARNGLPPPVQWKIFLRDLAHAIVVQREPTTPLVRLALTLGYVDSQAMSHAFRKGFGATPSFVRERLGWHWLALRWCERQRRDRNRQWDAGFDHARRRARPHRTVAARPL